MKFFVTFGAGHFGGLFRNRAIIFEAANELLVRGWMVQHFKGIWSGTYSYEGSDRAPGWEEQSKQYNLCPLAHVKIYDERGDQWEVEHVP